MSALLTLEDVAKQLNVHVRTLRRRMAESVTAGIRPGWLNLGGRVVRWRVADLDRWLTEFDEWQRLNSERTAEMDGASDGEHSTDDLGAVVVPISEPPSRSRRRSTASTPGASSGSPRQIVKQLLGSRT